MSSSSNTKPGTPSAEPNHNSNEPDQVLDDTHDAPVTSVGDSSADVGADMSDNDSILSDVDEAQFEDFDPANVTIDDRPAIAVDEDNVRLLGRHKRKRDEEIGDGEGGKKKKREGRREKPKKSRKKRDDDDDDFSGGQEVEGKRTRKKKATAEGGRKDKARTRKTTPENDEALDPETSVLTFLPCLIRRNAIANISYSNRTQKSP